MRRVPASCVALLAVAALTGASPAGGPIEWSKDVKLTQLDFKQKVPIAATDAAHSWVGIDIEWECRDDKPDVAVRATFDPDQSWWRGSVPSLWGGLDAGLSRSQLQDRRTAAQRDDDLLRHEQLHFDLTELAARKIRRELDRLVCLDPTNKAAVAKVIEELERAWLAEQARYDQETDHGTDQPAQREWDRRVRRELN
jgi:uncharacterized protein DUF922